MNVHIGTSGWNYPHWKGVFYPEGLKSREWLAFYGQRLDTLELNVTFYREAKATTFEKWRLTVPDGFLFSVKMSRFITHIRRLKVEAGSVERFLGNASALADKLGVVLIQLPLPCNSMPASWRTFSACSIPRSGTPSKRGTEAS